MKPAGIGAVFCLALATTWPAKGEIAECPPGSNCSGPPPVAAEPAVAEPSPADWANNICQVIASAASANALPADFFARVIWQESRFRPKAIGPVTRSGARALGIAQFMPATAAERQLHDPFDPPQALLKSAEFLRALQLEFGNLGLAAAAYNAGAQRVRDWLAGKRTLPSQTEAYVQAITGRQSHEWTGEGARIDLPLAANPCGEIARLSMPPQPAAGAPPGALVPPARAVSAKPPLLWGVQLIGDRSEVKALAAYIQLKKKYAAILGPYEPMVLRTGTGRIGAATWHRVRVATSTREAAQSLCARLRAAGADCLVQRN
jgi:hypothetical protein